MNTQYRKNLKAVLEASKTYCDESIESLKWELGTYDLSVETVNGTTMLLPTPANTIQASMVRIDGASEVSENLIPKEKLVATSTYQGITITNNNDGSITLNGTYTGGEGAGFKIVDNLSIPAGSYAIAYFNNKVSTGANDIFRFNAVNDATMNIGYLGSTTNLTAIKTISVAITSIWLRCSLNTSFDNITIKPMLVKGSTAPTTFVQGFTGIHNIELTGLKVEGNLISLNNATSVETSYGVTYSISNGVIKLSGTCSTTGSFSINLSNNIPIGQYYFKVFADNYAHRNGVSLIPWADANSCGNINEGQIVNVTSNRTSIGVYVSSGTNYSNTIIKPMLIKGTTAPTTYQPYIAPTTKTIDLSTILYNGSPLFEGNSLKAVNDVKDILTPYKATKKLGYVDLGMLNWEYNSNGVYISTTRINSIYNLKNAICSTYEYNGNANSGSASTMANNLSDKQMCSYSNVDNAGKLVVKDSALGTTGTPSGYLVYELATPIEVSIDFSQLVKFEAHSNGSITLVNTNNQDTTSTFKYLKEVAK